MNGKRQLTVEPLAKYEPPAYPSYLDPEPKAWLQINPYPFGGTLAGSLALSALGLLGIGAGVTAARAGEAVASSKAPAEKSPEFCDLCRPKGFHAGKGKCGSCGGDSGSPLLKHCSKCATENAICRMCGRSTKPLAHPFSVKNGGFPFPVPRMVKGMVAMPTRLSEREAVPIIEKVLKEAGLEPAAGVDPKLEGVSVRLDGWDAKKRIGFEFVTESDYEHGYWLRSTAGMNDAQRKRVEDYRAKGLSFDEIAKLEALSVDKKGYVAVINHRQYPHGWMAASSDPRLRAKYKELYAIKDPAKRKAMQAEVNKLRAEIMKKSKQTALEKLEKDVRGYISWLKKQGAL